MQRRDEGRELLDLAGLGQRLLEGRVVRGPGLAQELFALRGELGVDAAAVVLAQDACEEAAVLEAVDEARRGAAAQGRGARELLHAPRSSFPAFVQRALREHHRELGIVTEAWSPLGQGTVLGDPVLGAIADAHGVTPAQVVLRWHLQAGTVAIPKSVTPERIASNLDLLGFELSAEQVAAIDGLDRADGRIGPDPDAFNG